MMKKGVKRKEMMMTDSEEDAHYTNLVLIFVSLVYDIVLSLL